jgi:hypothetical protein
VRKIKKIKGARLNFAKAILLIIFMILFSAGFSYSQQDSTAKKIVINKDTVEIGKYYSFYIADKEAFIGLLTAADKNTVLIYANGKIMTLKKMDIVAIEDARAILYEMSIAKKKKGNDRVFWYFGAGYLMSKDSDFSNGFNFHAQSLLTFDNYLGLRADFDYDHFQNNGHSYTGSYGTSDIYRYEGGSINAFLFRINMATGTLDPENLINIYVVPGLGIGGYFKTPETYTHINPGYPTYTNVTDDKTLHFTVGISAEAVVDVRLTKKLRCYSAFQYNTWATYMPNHNNLKLGIILLK